MSFIRTNYTLTLYYAILFYGFRKRILNIYKQGYTLADRAAIYGRSFDQKESPVDWIPHEDVTRQANKADYLLSTVVWSQKERAPSSPVQGCHQEKPDAERHKDRLMDIILRADR